MLTPRRDFYSDADDQLGDAYLDPRDPHPSRDGIFRDHNCAGCGDGARPCREGSPNRCSWPHARND